MRRAVGAGAPDAPPIARGCVEVPAAPAAIPIALSRTDGPRLGIPWATSALPREAVGRAFGAV